MAKKQSTASKKPTAPFALAGARREAALNATYQLAAIFDAIIECARLDLGEAKWKAFDVEQLPYVVRGLALRGRALSNATMAALIGSDNTGGKASTEDEVERVIFAA